MTKLEPLFLQPPYGIAKAEKDALLTAGLRELTTYHRAHCAAYDAMLTGLGADENAARHYTELPFLPVGLFKKLRLASVAEEDVSRVITSSGTSGQAVSQIVIDSETAALQQRALALLVSDFIGEARLPMLLIDCPSVLHDRRRFTARGTGILGFSIFGKNRVFALDEDMKLDFDALDQFLEKLDGKPFLLFGFTFIVWQHFYRALLESEKHYDLSAGILIHGGGWKTLRDQAVPPAVFRRCLREVCGLTRIHDYYGMAEQTGSIFMQCEQGHFHCSNFSGVAVRRANDFSLVETGERGILQVLSLLPRSYPGHSLLTGDEGALLGEDDCPCGRRGAYFEVYGRLENAELRGCSDAYAAGL